MTTRVGRPIASFGEEHVHPLPHLSERGWRALPQLPLGHPWFFRLVPSCSTRFPISDVILAPAAVAAAQ